MNYLATRTSLSPIQRGFVPSFVNYKKGWTRLTAASDKVYQLLAHGRWFSLGIPASSTTKTGHHDIAEILLKVALNTINQIYKSIYFFSSHNPMGHMTSYCYHLLVVIYRRLHLRYFLQTTGPFGTKLGRNVPWVV